MRLFRFLPFLGLAFLLFAAACNSKDTVTPISGFSFKVDTVKYNVKSGDALLLDTLGAKALQVRGLTNNFAQNAILLIKLDSANARPGSYYGTMVFSDSILSSDFASTWIGDSVKVNITKFQGGNAVGTFSGELFQNEKSKSLTEGQFNVSY